MKLRATAPSAAKESRLGFARRGRLDEIGNRFAFEIGGIRRRPADIDALGLGRGDQRRRGEKKQDLHTESLSSIAVITSVPTASATSRPRKVNASRPSRNVASPSAARRAASWSIAAQGACE